MQNQLITLIREKNYRKILDRTSTLNDADRYAVLDILRTLEPEILMNKPRPEEYDAAYYKEYRTISSYRTYLMICCVRKKKDLSLTVSDWQWDKNDSALHAYLRQPILGAEPLTAYFELYPPDYLDEVVAGNAALQQLNNDFHLLWELYKSGFVTFDEETFVRSLFIIPMSDRSVPDDVRFLADHSEAIGKVLLQFYKYEIPVLDLSKWYAPKGFCCKKCTYYWDEVFSELLSLGLLNNRSIIRNLLGTLTHSWKKGHLDWHIRLLKQFNTTAEEYMANQDYLFAALSAASSSVSNFVINTAATLYKEKEFDAETFIHNLPHVFIKEKSDKAILKALDILSYLLKTNPALQKYADYASNALIQPDEKIQEKAAQLLKQHITAEEELQQIAEPFIPALKQKARDILCVKSEKIEEITVLALENLPIDYPETWEDFLFHIGKTLSTLCAPDIDIMYNGFLQLQDKFPEDYFSQLKPFIKKAGKAGSEKELLVYISEFFENWLLPGKKYTVSNSYFSGYNSNNPNPFMRNRNQWVLNRMQRGCKLPLLSTPTHHPFYVHPAVLVSRLAEYESCNEEVPVDDLIVACNRILKGTVTDEVKHHVQQLKGYYAQAVQYLLGVSDIITFDKDTLPLWAQITRTRQADGIYKEFEQTKAKDYPAVTSPLFVSYKIEREHSGQYHWDYLVLDKPWKPALRWGERERVAPYLHFYAGLNGMGYHSKEGLRYWLSMVPHYADAVLLHDMPDTASGNEVREFEYCQFPLQYLIENQLPVHHCGWIYIALCLIFEKKVTRSLAAEYINLAFGQGFINREYLSTVIADMVMNKFAPVNRLIEYFDQVHADCIREFQLLIIGKCIRQADRDNLPVNFKKLEAYYKEIHSLLGKMPGTGMGTTQNAVSILTTD